MSDEPHTEIGRIRLRPKASHSRNGSARASEAHSETSSGYGPRANGPARARNGHRRPAGEGSFEQDLRQPWGQGPTRERAQPYFGSDAELESGFRLPFDPLRLIGAAKRNLLWIIAGGMLLAIAGFFLGASMVDHKISMGLMRKTSNAMRNEGVQVIDKFMVREYSDQTLYSFMTSGEVLNGVVEKARTNPLLAGLRFTAQDLAGAVSVRPSDNPDFVILTMKAFADLRSMVELINLYAREVVAYTRKVQRTESSVIADYLTKQVQESDKNIEKLTGEMRQFAQTGLGDYEQEASLEIKQLIAMKEKLSAKKLELDTLAKRIEVRRAQLGSQSSGSTRVELARAELDQMRLTMKDANPLVIQKRAEIALLEQRAMKGESSKTAASSAAMSSHPLYLGVLDLEAQKPALEAEIADTQRSIKDLEKTLGSRTGTDIGFSLKKAELQSQRLGRESLQQRQREAELFLNNSLGYFGVQEPATMGNVNHKARWMKVGLLSAAAGLLGLLASLGLVMLTEAMDTSLKTPEDITRVTGLPVLATLGDLRKMSAAAQVNWAFRTLTLLKGKLNRNLDQALVCGIISANHGEGRSTWVSLLTSAASQRGLRVLTVDTRPAAPAPNVNESRKAEAKAETKTAPATESAAPMSDGSAIHLPDHEETGAQTGANGEASLISTPAKVAEHFDDPNSQSIVHIPLPGWVWSLERRKQWQDALESWKDIENIVIFVELPPASEPEAVLLAENLPQVIWLCGSGMADAVETNGHLETIQHARCNLVGAVLNHAPPPLFNNRLARWFQRISTCLALAGTLAAVQAQNPAAPARDAVEATAEIRPTVAGPGDPLSFSASARRKRAAWQEKLTFGPGDSMDIHVYGKPAMSRTNIMVGPDGRVNFLQAAGVQASGLSVEELRQRLDEEMAKYYTEAAAPRTIVIPVAFSSKKYFMLGKVNAKGAYVLDRPLTLLEAVARAKGLETGLYRRNTVEMADLGQSFLVRNGAKMGVDFEKLFQEGDLTQNVLLEPNDYIYFASTAAREIYVLGEVMSPGPIGFGANATVLTAIADRGGYSERAFKKRVLVVRGSLREPETFVVDTGAVLDARMRDFKLQPRDIVYVSSRPWIKAEELLDEAASSFIQGAVTTWSGVNVGPIITKRLLPRSRPSE